MIHKIKIEHNNELYIIILHNKNRVAYFISNPTNSYTLLHHFSFFNRGSVRPQIAIICYFQFLLCHKIAVFGVFSDYHLRGARGKQPTVLKGLRLIMRHLCQAMTEIETFSLIIYQFLYCQH
jgi:hypothetical protein